MPQSIEPFFLGYGVLGVMFLLVVIGILVPKYVVDEYRKREDVKDQIIKELTQGLNRAVDTWEAERRDRK